jgi:phosphoheptose isomerase
MNDDRVAFITSALVDGVAIRRTLIGSAPQIAAAAGLLVDALRAGRKVILFGNGGSAADAQHIAAELTGRYTVDRRPLAALALTTDTSVLTAIANDYGYGAVFARQLRALGAAGDVAIAISTSGGSENVRNAVAVARELGLKTIGLTGAAGAALVAQCDVGIRVPTRETARIQELHITIGHLLCALVDAEVARIPLPPHVASTAGTKRVALDALLPLREHYRQQGRVVVWTNGCFDLLHAGHVASLRAARALGDILVVGVNDDASVRAAKGPGRPVLPLDQRIAMVGALEVVDHVVPFAEPTPAAALARLQPDIHTKGSDYAPPHGAPIPEADVVRGYGGRIHFLPMVEGLSTTALIAQIRSSR